MQLCSCTLNLKPVLKQPTFISLVDDPCKAESYATLNDFKRSINFEVPLNDPGLCDDNLKEGWYRSVSPAGGDMPTQLVDLEHCGTHFPIYLNGKLITTTYSW